MPSNQRYIKVATDQVAEEDEQLDTSKMVKNKAESNPSGGDSGLPSTHSSQQLMQTDTESVGTSQEGSRDIPIQYSGFGSISAKHWFTVGVLCFVNLINYMDRFTIAGVLVNIQKNFNVGDDQGGLLQTAFVLSYMICAPIFGYLGDRYSRRWIMILGVALWSLTTLLGSFMHSFGWFLTFRALVGVGEASYSTIAPTIISDLFVHNLRSKMLALFYFAIPVGSGLGYIVGSETAELFNSWRYALRVTPILGVAAVVLIYMTNDPERGQSEGSHNMKTTSYKKDLIAIGKNKSFMLSTAGFTCVAFVAGALAWWGPSFILLGMQMQPGRENTTLNDVSFIFGAITMTSGIIGVPLGSFLSQKLIKRFPRVDPLICGAGLFISAPFLTLALYFVSSNAVLTYTFIFFGELALNLNWAIVADILLYVVIPTRRSTAEAFQILISHALGDAGSPYLVGVVSEALKHYFASTNTQNVQTSLLSDDSMYNSTSVLAKPSFDVLMETPQIKFQSLQYALLTTCFVEVLGGFLFFCTALYIIRDKTKTERQIAASQQPEPQHIIAEDAATESESQ